MSNHWLLKLYFPSWLQQLCLYSFLLIISSTAQANGKLLATPGVAEVEGAGGGGIVAWAQLAGYASEDEISGGAFCSRADVDNYQLNVCGAQVNLYNRLELSYAQQKFAVPALNSTITQNIVGAKMRLYGDIVYSKWPQLSVGFQRKELDDASIAMALGAEKDSGTDIYLAASKLHLGVAAGYNLFWNATLRNTQANQLGILGYGSTNKQQSLQAEVSIAVFLSSKLAFGYEHRQKPDNLQLGEEDWRDLFLAWFPNKHLHLTIAYLDLGSIAGVRNQTGWYLSLMGNL